MNTDFAKCFLHLQRAEFALGLGARKEPRAERVGGGAEPFRGFGLEIQVNVSLLPDLGVRALWGLLPGFGQVGSSVPQFPHLSTALSSLGKCLQ